MMRDFGPAARNGATLPSALLLLAGCATQNYSLKTIPPEAEIVVMSEKDLTKPVKTLGKGEARLSGEDLSGKLYGVQGKGLQTMLIVFPKVNEEGALTLSLPPADSSLQQRIADLESQLTAERRASSELKAGMEKRIATQHDVARHLANAQRHVTLGSVGEAERILQDLFTQPEETLPAAAYVLRGKVKLMQNKRGEARADFMKAVSLSDKETEAKSLLESAK
jgi:hypothetical protein